MQTGLMISNKSYLILRVHKINQALPYTPPPELSAYFHERRSLNNFHRDRVITFEQIAE